MPMSMDIVNLQSLLVREWGLMPPRTVTFVPEKPYSVVAILDYGNEKGVLKATTINSPERQGAVNRCIEYLRQKGMPVPAIHRTADGRTFAVHEEHTLTLMDYVPGTTYDGSKEQLREAGVLLGRLHRTLGNARLSPAATGEVYPNDPDFLESLLRFEGVIGNVAAALLQSFESVPESFPLPQQLGHYDFNGSNLLFQNGKISGLLDFDLIRTAERARDIAVAMYKLNRGKQSLRRQQLFLDAYRSAHVLDEQEIKALPELYFDETRRKLTYILRRMTNEGVPLERELQSQLSQMRELPQFEAVTTVL